MFYQQERNLSWQPAFEPGAGVRRLQRNAAAVRRQQAFYNRQAQSAPAAFARSSK
jgi:hypothetical protein